MYSLPFFGMAGGGAPMFDNVDDYLQFLGASLWLDAADATTVLTTNNLVTQWSDKSGNNRHATQGNSANQPTYENGTLVFSGNKFLAAGTNTSWGFLHNNQSTVFVVTQGDAGTGRNFLMSTGGEATAQRGYMLSVLGQDKRIMISRGASGSIAVDYSNLSSVVGGKYNILSTVLDLPNPTASLRGLNIVNGTELPRTNTIATAASTSDTSSSNLRIGTWVANSTFMTGKISEVLIFPSLLSTSDRQIIEGYLAHKWGLVADLPNNHPYKSVAPAILPTQLRIEATTPFLDIETEAQTFTFTVYRGGNPDKESSVTYTTTATNRLTVVATDFVGDIFPSGTVTFAVGETTKTITIQLKQSDSSKEFVVTLSSAINADIVSGSATAIGIAGLERYLISTLNTNLWLDAADATTVLTTNNLVSQWSDKSGKENDLVQATSSSQPTYANNTVSFTSARFLAITSKQVFANTSSGSVFFVGRQPTSTQGGWGRFGNNTTTTLTPNSSGNFRESFLTGTVYTLTSNPTVPYPLPNSIVSFANNGSQLSLWRNGVQVSSTSMTYTIPGTTHQIIGGNQGDFDHQEILMFPSVLSESDRQTIEGYLAHKWGLVASLPNEHPYRFLAPAISPTQLRIEATTPSLDIETEAQTFTFTVYRAGNLNKESSVTYTTTATNRLTVVATDFVGNVFPSGTVTFAVGETTKTITIQLKQSDSSKEFAVTLSGAVNADIASGSATAIGFAGIEAYLMSTLNTNLWLDAADSTTVSATNNLVSQWSDKSGNNRHLAQSQAANQPTYSNNAINFDGGARILERSVQTLPNNASIFLVISYNSNNGEQGVLVSQNNTSPRFFIQANSGSLRGYSASYFSAGSYTLNTPEITNFTVRSASAEMRRNGVVTGTINTAGGTNDYLGIGSRGTLSSNNRWTGFIREVVVFEGELGESDRQIIEGYLAHKWGLDASLPANHPYKSVAPF
jgi:hypothetical protein